MIMIYSYVMIILLSSNYYKIDSYRSVLHFSMERRHPIIKTSQSSSSSISSSTALNLDYDMFIKDRISFNINLQYKIKHSTLSEADHWLSHIYSKIISEQQPHQHEQKNIISSSYLNRSCADTINIYIKDAIDNRSNLSRAIMLFESYFSSGLGR